MADERGRGSCWRVAAAVGLVWRRRRAAEPSRAPASGVVAPSPTRSARCTSCRTSRASTTSRPRGRRGQGSTQGGVNFDLTRPLPDRLRLPRHRPQRGQRASSTTRRATPSSSTRRPRLRARRRGRRQPPGRRAASSSTSAAPPARSSGCSPTSTTTTRSTASRRSARSSGWSGWSARSSSASGHTTFIYPERDDVNTAEVWASVTLDDSFLFNSERPVLSPYVFGGVRLRPVRRVLPRGGRQARDRVRGHAVHADVRRRRRVRHRQPAVHRPPTRRTPASSTGTSA